MQTYNKNGLTRREWVRLYLDLAAIRLRDRLLRQSSALDFLGNGLRTIQSTLIQLGR